MFDHQQLSVCGVCVCVFRGELKRLIQGFRASSGGTLSSFSVQDLVSGVSNLILNHQVRLESPKTPQSHIFFKYPQIH